MKKYSTNYAIKLAGLTLIAFMALLNSAISQEPEMDNDLIIYSMAVSSGQQVKFRLPKDIRPGDIITGTLIKESEINSGAVNKNSSTLEGMVIEIDGKQTRLDNRLFSFLVPAGIASLPFLLKNSGGEIIERGQIPIDIFGTHPMGADLTYTTIYNTYTDKKPPVNVTRFSPERVGQPGQALKVTGSFDGNAANTNVSLNSQACEAIAESPRESFILVPEKATTGVSNISIKENNISEEHKVNVAVLNLSANKTNLQKGQKTTIKVTVSGLEGIAAEQLNYKLNVENQSPQTISFLKESGNVIVKDINTADVKNGKYEFSTKIIAQSSGPFSVQAIFFKPVSKNPCVDDYYDCVKNAAYESESAKKAVTANGITTVAATAQAALIKVREEKKAECLQILIRCMKKK